MQFHKSPSGPDCAGYHKFSVWASSHRLQWGSDNTNPIEKFRLFGEKRERRWCGGGCSFRTFGLELHWIGGIIAPPRSIPQYENPDSSPFDIVPWSWEKRDPLAFILDGFLCGKFHHLFIFWPHWMRWQMRKAWAYLKEITNFHFIWCLASPGLEKFPLKMNPRIILFRAGGLKEEIGLWQLWNMFEILQFCSNNGGNVWHGKSWKQLGIRKKSERCLRAEMWRGCTQGLESLGTGKRKK